METQIQSEQTEQSEKMINVLQKSEGTFGNLTIKKYLGKHKTLLSFNDKKMSGCIGVATQRRDGVWYAKFHATRETFRIPVPSDGDGIESVLDVEFKRL